MLQRLPLAIECLVHDGRPPNSKVVYFLANQVRVPGPSVPCKVEAAFPIRIESDVAVRFGRKKADELAVKATELDRNSMCLPDART